MKYYVMEWGIHCWLRYAKTFKSLEEAKAYVVSKHKPNKLGNISRKKIVHYNYIDEHTVEEITDEVYM